MEMASNETIKQAVMAGMGVSFLSRHTVELELQTGRLVVLDVRGTPVIRHWHVAHLAKKRLSPTAAAFKAFVLDQGARRYAGGPGFERCALNRASAWEREKSDWPNREASRFVDAGGLRWHVQQAGSGPVLLLVHGTGASSHLARNVARLARSTR